MLATLLVAAALTGPGYVIHGDHGIAGVEIARATSADARARFGPPASARATSASDCVLRWPKLGLRLQFLSLGRGASCRHGALVVATVTHRSRWRTALGLRIGDPAARIARLYPHATRHGPSAVWLSTRHACKEVGGFAFPGLLARVRAGRVAALVARTTPCE
jgi:hypothetical protein